MSNIFDDDLFDDNEPIESTVMADEYERQFLNWKEHVESIEMVYKINQYNAETKHNLLKIEKDNNNITLTFDEKTCKAAILCPITFITTCPIPIDFINMSEYNDENKDKRIFLYCPCEFNENNEIIERGLTMDDIDTLSCLNLYPDCKINVTDIIFLGSFKSIDVYKKYINTISSLPFLKNTQIWIHYDTKILSINNKKYTHNIATLLQNNKKDVLCLDKVKIMYANFPTNRFIKY